MMSIPSGHRDRTRCCSCCCAKKACRRRRRCQRAVVWMLPYYLFLTLLWSSCEAFRLVAEGGGSASLLRRVPHRIQRQQQQQHEQLPSLHTGFQDIQSRTFLTSSTLLRAWKGNDDDDDSLPAIYGWSSFKRRRKSTLTALFGKGDGKKKRRKNKPSSSTSSSPTTEPAPLRVSNNINIPVRKQIAWANLNKQYRQQQSQTSFRRQKPVVRRTKYRRTWDEQEIQEKAEERRRRGQDPDWDVILNRTAASPLMIVDGYNIIYKWPRLKKHMVKGDTNRARQLLIDDLENLRTIKGWRIECVFDGTKRSTIGPLGQGAGRNSNSNPATQGLDRANKQSVSKYGVRVVFTGVGIEADSYIESRCARAKNVTRGAITGSFIVATDDALIRLAGHSAGAHVMSADRFVQELRAVKKAVEYRVEAAVAKVNGHPMRPVQLRGNKNTASLMQTGFGRHSVLLEDKRNRTKTKRKEEDVEDEYDIDLSNINVNDLDWVMQLPNRTITNKYTTSS